MQLLAQLSDLAPEEFLDPITLVLMVQPMTLPTSPHVLDRQTLVEHLAINPTGAVSYSAVHSSLSSCEETRLFFCHECRPIQQEASHYGDDLPRRGSQNQVRFSSDCSRVCMPL